jgi:hypothetical protein
MNGQSNGKVTRTILPKTYVVRVVLRREDVAMNVSLLLDLLVAAGVIYLHRNDVDGVCFDIYPPKDVGSARSAGWAFRTSEKLQRKGINGVKAPEWPRE